MATVVKTTFKLKRGTAQKWKELNLILAAGEPGFEIDTNSLKIGNGETPWNELPYIAAGVTGGGEDGIVVDTILSSTSFNPIANKTVTEALARIESLIETYDFGAGFVVTEADGIKSIELDVDYLTSLMPEIDTSQFVTKEELEKFTLQLSELAQIVAGITIPTKISELENDAGLATESYVQQKIAEAELGDADVDLSNYYTKEEVDNKIPSIEGLVANDYAHAVFTQNKYEVAPIEGMYVKYNLDEIRLNTQRVVPVHQSVGSGGNPNAYYATFKAYAPEGARYSIESNGSFTDPEPLPLSADKYGRYYSVIWITIATYDGTSWTLVGDSSTVNEYRGFNFTFTWYAEDKTTILGADKVRVLLTNDECHNDLVPEVVAKHIEKKIAEIPTVDLTGYATKEEIPTKVGELENDAGYLTEHQDLSEYALKSDIPSIVHLATKEELNEIQTYNEASNIKRKFEVFAPKGVFVDYRDNEIRINTQRAEPSFQQGGAGANPNLYYIEFRAYAPKEATNFRETENGVWDDTIYDFSDSFAGVDEFGRKYSQAWMAIASYDGTNWSLFGDKSTVDKYLGFLYQYEWRTEDQVIGLDSIRIILTNDTCHNDLVPDVVARRIETKVAELKTAIEQEYVSAENAVTKDELSNSVADAIEAGDIKVETLSYGTF